MKAKLLNVRAHLEHAQMIVEGLKKYGMCSALEHELAAFALINRAILRKADERRAKGNRKDIAV